MPGFQNHADAAAMATRAAAIATFCIRAMEATARSALARRWSSEALPHEFEFRTVPASRYMLAKAAGQLTVRQSEANGVFEFTSFRNHLFLQPPRCNASAKA
jgi:hypothetical protein